MVADNVLRVHFHQDLSDIYPGELGRLMNRLRYSMEMSVWLRKNREARPTEDPDTWDFHALDRLDREYEMVGLP